MSKNTAREALCKALTFYIGAYINLIFSWGVFKARFLFIKIPILDSPIKLSTQNYRSSSFDALYSRDLSSLISVIDRLMCIDHK
jgi:hypothetical protein